MLPSSPQGESVLTSRLRSLLALALLATGCASVPMAPAEADRAAKEFRTTPGKSNVYVFRDESMGAAVKMSVLLDGRLLGDTAAKTFLLTSVEPGHHALLSKTENDSRVEFDAQPGTNVFVWQEVKMGMWAARSLLQIVDEAEAKSRVAACSLAVTEPPPPPAAPATAAIPRS
jgi:Protein of unknown function (DUF2846)